MRKNTKSVKSHFLIIRTFVGPQFMIQTVEYSQRYDKYQFLKIHILDPHIFCEIGTQKNLIPLSNFTHFVWFTKHDAGSLCLRPIISSIEKFWCPGAHKLYKN